MDGEIVMRMLALTLSALGFGLSAGAWGAEGLVSVSSPYAPKETMDRFVGLVEKKGMTVFARIDHAAGAAKVGKSLLPAEVLVFGNPQGGTALMQCAQTAGIDLPMKALVWQDASGQVWLGYNDASFIAKRHDAPQCPVTDNLNKVLAALARDTVAP
jgi:uncharacterized protein (DUF302 family)